MSEYLTTAKDELAGGWIQGDLHNTQGVCMLGALAYADWALLNTQLGPSKHYRAAELLLRKKIAEMWPDLPVFIDDYRCCPGSTTRPNAPTKTYSTCSTKRFCQRKSKANSRDHADLRGML